MRKCVYIAKNENTKVTHFIKCLYQWQCLSTGTKHVHCEGHAKLRRWVLRVRRVLQRRGCIMLVRCKRGCYIVKQHCLWCVRAGENELSRSDAHSITGLCLCAHIFRLSMSVCLQNCTENHVSTVTNDPVCNSLLATPGRSSRLHRCS